jgi:hypothetical protein
MDSNRDSASVLSFVFLALNLWICAAGLWPIQRVLHLDESGIKCDQFGLCN